jgi:hypothetical protein
MADAICRLATDDEMVTSAAKPMTMYFGPEEVLLNLEVEFRTTASMNDIAKAVDDMEKRIRERFPIIKRTFIEATKLTAGMRIGLRQ